MSDYSSPVQNSPRAGDLALERRAAEYEARVQHDIDVARLNLVTGMLFRPQKTVSEALRLGYSIFSAFGILVLAAMASESPIINVVGVDSLAAAVASNATSTLSVSILMLVLVHQLCRILGGGGSLRAFAFAWGLSSMPTILLAAVSTVVYSLNGGPVIASDLTDMAQMTRQQQSVLTVQYCALALLQVWTAIITVFSVKFVHQFSLWRSIAACFAGQVIVIVVAVSISSLSLV
ncbi:YIP1 family protein [Marinobacterium stanieri]|uniref:Yip1 domain-containing protein n=1 Tax=Marinobacterium stanieri TaxID=49186 RepID=A0A1N6XD02_9GAMM|nr:YIP1 family protein [Marinobacterium stanieri]SIR00150.1 Yip1 domain-containing protein [Marinobacterium stanieri]